MGDVLEFLCQLCGGADVQGNARGSRTKASERSGFSNSPAFSSSMTHKATGSPASAPPRVLAMAASIQEKFRIRSALPVLYHAQKRAWPLRGY